MHEVARKTDDTELVSKAALNAADWLGLNSDQLANALGVSSSTVARARQGRPISGQKTLEIALYLVRIYRALYAILGGNKAQMEAWMDAPNDHLHGEIPSELVQRIDGLVAVLRYLDAMRGRV